jgi:heme-degrading monooxygenase HmoA
MAMSKHYRLATYRVIPGKEDDFIKTWNDLALTLGGLRHPPEWGALIRSTRDATLFHSFGPWDEAEHIAAMRKSPQATAAFAAMQSLCVETLPGDYELVAHVHVRDQQAEVSSQ